VLGNPFRDFAMVVVVGQSLVETSLIRSGASCKAEKLDDERSALKYKNG
jgi:hypothetical protein